LLTSLDLEYLPKPWYVRDLLSKLPQYRVAAQAADSPDASSPVIDQDAEIVIMDGVASVGDSAAQTEQDGYGEALVEPDDEGDATIPHRPAMFRSE
jgi:hypothetical protein